MCLSGRSKDTLGWSDACTSGLSAGGAASPIQLCVFLGFQYIWRPDLTIACVPSSQVQSSGLTRKKRAIPAETAAKIRKMNWADAMLYVAYLPRACGDTVVADGQTLSFPV